MGKGLMRCWDVAGGVSSTGERAWCAAEDEWERNARRREEEEEEEGGRGGGRRHGIMADWM